MPQIYLSAENAFIADAGVSDETVEHFIFVCHQFITVRASFKEPRFELASFGHPLADIARHKPLLSSFIAFVLRSKRLDRLPSS